MSVVESPTKMYAPNSPTMLSTMIYCERVKLRPKLTTITLITWFVAQVDNSSFGRRCGHQKFRLPNENNLLYSATYSISGLGIK
ncbi:hypothetical protein J6590_093102 [Homalodisca vitripennis]|nr:hypothetical protein J6590_093102 [Homalodisca vitripennis]